MSNLLGEVMQLSSRPTSLCVGRRCSQMVACGCQQGPWWSGSRSIWASEGLRCHLTDGAQVVQLRLPAAQAKAIAADGSGAAEQLHRALARATPQKLPTSLVKLLTQPNLTRWRACERAAQIGR